jgi:hypothetical protein
MVKLPNKELKWIMLLLCGGGGSSGGGSTSVAWLFKSTCFMDAYGYVCMYVRGGP